MKKCGIYKIENLINGKVYIGQSQDIETRWKVHINELDSGTKKNKKFLNAWKKYGMANFKFEILEECSIDELDELEKYYIQKYSSFGDGYNLTIGGSGTKGHEVSKDAKNKISLKSKRNWSDEKYSNHMSLVHSQNRPIICVNTLEVFFNSNEASRLTGYNNSNLIRACNKKNMACGKDEDGNPLYWCWFDEYTGYKWQDKVIPKGGNNRKKIICIETGMIFNSCSDAGAFINAHRSCIAKNIKGQLKSVKGFHFQELEK